MPYLTQILLMTIANIERGAHVRAIYRGTIFPSVGSSRFSVPLTGGMARRFAEQSEANRGHVLNVGSYVRY